MPPNDINNINLPVQRQQRSQPTSGHRREGKGPLNHKFTQLEEVQNTTK